MNQLLKVSFLTKTGELPICFSENSYETPGYEKMPDASQIVNYVYSFKDFAIIYIFTFTP